MHDSMRAMHDSMRAGCAVLALLAGCDGVVDPSDRRLDQVDASVDPVTSDAGQDAASPCRVLETSLDIEDTSDLEQATAMLTECTIITGHLRVGNVASLEGLEDLQGVGADMAIEQSADMGMSLASLRGLNGLASVGRDVQIVGTDITSLEGLAALRSVGGLLSLTSTPALSSLNGADQLESLGGLAISGAPALKNVAGLDGATIDGDLILRETGLVHLQGLERFTGAGSVTIHYNDALESIQGLSTLGAIGGELDLLRNPALTRISLDALTMVAEGVSFVQLGAPQLSNLEGLHSLTTIGGDLVISSTPLESLDGLSQLESVGGRVLIEANPALPQCEATALSERLAVSCTCQGNDEAGSCAP